MFIFNHLFWIILGLGVAIPSTATILINIIVKINAGDNYQFNLVSLFRVYLVALIGWSIFFAEVFQ